MAVDERPRVPHRQQPLRRIGTGSRPRPTLQRNEVTANSNTAAGSEPRPASEPRPKGAVVPIISCLISTREKSSFSYLSMFSFQTNQLNIGVRIAFVKACQRPNLKPFPLGYTSWQ